MSLTVNVGHFSLIAGADRVFYPPARPSSLSKVHVFARGSLGEFCQPSREGKQVFPLPGKLALLACRPSRELVDFFVYSNAREGEINLCTGGQREVSNIVPNDGCRYTIFRLAWTIVFVFLHLSNWLISCAIAQFPSFELNALSQPVAEIGSTFELSLIGNRTDELRSLHFSSEQVTAESICDPSALQGEKPCPTGRFKTHIAAAAATGACEVRGLGRLGLSNPRRLLLVRKPVEVVQHDHSRAVNAVELSAENILLARCQPQQRNYYRLHLDVGQSLHLAVYARQLDSRATPLVELRSSDRQILARGRAIGGWPAAIDYQATQAVDVSIIVHDAIFLGGPEYPYAIECAIAAASSVALPLELDQLLLPSLQKLNSPPANLEQITTTSYGSPEGRDTHDAQLPLHEVGTFATDRSVCSHEFEALKEQQLVIEVTSHSIGQLTDPRLVLYRLLPSSESVPAEDNKVARFTQQQLLELDDQPLLGDVSLRIHRRDPLGRWTVPEDGRYRIELQDNESSQRQSNQTQYVLDIRPPRPHFQLLAYPPYPNNNPALARPTELNLMRGGSRSLRVIALRQEGFNEPIEASISGLPAGVMAQPITIHPEQSEASITLTCHGTADAWSGPIQIIGSGTMDRTQENIARLATIIWPSIPTHNAVQSRLCDDLWLCVNPLDTAPLTIALGSESLMEVKQGEKLSIPIQITRRDGGAAACLLRPRDLPAKVTAPELTISADQPAGIAELSVAADAALGEFSIWMQSETKIRWQDNPQALQRAEVRLAELQSELTATAAAERKLSLEEAIKQVMGSIEALKTATAEKDLIVFLPTTTQRIRVISP